jgi:hypothetical protein
LKKPNRETILAAVPLSRHASRGRDPIKVCGVCGVEVDPQDLASSVWREHDDIDRPIGGNEALVFIGPSATHAACKKVLEKHPRLYAEVTGDPGCFPRLCGPCVHRDGLNCKHPNLAANGGPGLEVQLSGGFPPGTIVCTRRGMLQPVRNAVECAGRRTLKLVSEAT